MNNTLDMLLADLVGGDVEFAVRPHGSRFEATATTYYLTNGLREREDFVVVEDTAKKALTGALLMAAGVRS